MHQIPNGPQDAQAEKDSHEGRQMRDRFEHRHGHQNSEIQKNLLVLASTGVGPLLMAPIRKKMICAVPSSELFDPPRAWRGRLTLFTRPAAQW
jgi:hypothetical protein